MAALAWMFLKANWKWILIGLAILSLFGYIGYLKHEAGHYKKLYGEAKLEIAEIKSREEAQKAAAAAITKKYEDLRVAYSMALEQRNTELQKRIANDKELASVKLSLAAARLFNESKQSGDSTPTVEVHDGATPTAEEGSVTLTSIFQVVAENDKNHLRCIQQVTDWQNFWRDYEASVELTRGSNHDPTRPTH